MTRLRRSRPYETAGFQRRGRGRGYSFLDGAGHPVARADRERAQSLVLPPAWRDVWISAWPNAHIQAVGVDAAGRRQYVYHPDWRLAHDQEKFDRMLDLAAALAAARARVTRDLRLDGLPRERVLAAAFRILDTVAIRVGGEQYAASSGARGLSTLLGRHAQVAAGTVRLRFPAKGGIAASVSVDDDDLAATLTTIAAGPRSRLLAWESAGTRRAVRASDINDYVLERTGGPFTAKDFRTLRGTIAAAQRLAELGPVDSARARTRAAREAAVAASEVLGNTPTVARSSYIDPRVLDRYDRGQVLDRAGSPEAALLRLLQP